MYIKKNPDTEKKLISSCIELFSTKGLKGTSIRDIANAMGMSIFNIYHHFGSKKGLMIAILKYSFEPLFNEMKKVSELELDPLKRFKLLIQTHILTAEKRKKETFIFFHFMNEEKLSDEATQIDRELQRKILEIYLKEIRALKSLGYLPHRSPTIVAFNTIAIINWFVKWYRPDGPLSVKEIIQEILSFVLYGIQQGPMESENHDQYGREENPF